MGLFGRRTANGPAEGSTAAAKDAAGRGILRSGAQGSRGVRHQRRHAPSPGGSRHQRSTRKLPALADLAVGERPSDDESPACAADAEVAESLREGLARLETVFAKRAAAFPGRRPRSPAGRKRGKPSSRSFPPRLRFGGGSGWAGLPMDGTKTALTANAAPGERAPALARTDETQRRLSSSSPRPNS